MLGKRVENDDRLLVENRGVETIIFAGFLEFVAFLIGKGRERRKKGERWSCGGSAVL